MEQSDMDKIESRNYWLGKIKVLQTLTLIFLDRRKEDKSETSGSKHSPNLICS
jgi:hypothetical protein